MAGQGYDSVDIFNDGEPVFFQRERVLVEPVEHGLQGGRYCQ